MYTKLTDNDLIYILQQGVSLARAEELNDIAFRMSTALKEVDNRLSDRRANMEFLAYLEEAVKAAGFEIKHDGGSLGDSNFRIEKVATHD